MDRLPTDLSLLPALHALLDECNVTRAAERLGISQPALSAQLARLRRDLGDPLLMPAANGRGMVKTARGAELALPLAGALGSLRDVLTPPAAFDPAHSCRLFIVAMNDNAAIMLGGGLARAVQSAGTGMRLAIVQPGPDAEARLEAGSLDLLLGSDRNVASTLIRRPLLRETFATAVRQGHPRGEVPLDLDEFCALDHIIVSATGRGFDGPVDRALAETGRRRRVAVSVQSYAVVPTLLAQTDLACTLPRRFLQRFATELRILEPQLMLPEYILSAIFHARAKADAGHLWLRAQLAEVAGSPSENADL